MAVLAILLQGLLFYVLQSAQNAEIRRLRVWTVFSMPAVNAGGFTPVFEYTEQETIVTEMTQWMFEIV